MRTMGNLSLVRWTRKPSSLVPVHNPEVQRWSVKKCMSWGEMRPTRSRNKVKQSTVWMFKVKILRSSSREPSVGKLMVVSFFDIEGHVATVLLLELRTFNADWYSTVCFLSVQELLWGSAKHRPSRTIFITTMPAHTQKADSIFCLRKECNWFLIRPIRLT